MNLKSNIEIIPSERGKTWIVAEAFTIVTRYGEVTVTQGFRHDRYTFAPNLTDEIPAVVHDFLCKEKKFDDGHPCTRRQADRILYDLILDLDARLEFPPWITVSSKIIAPIYWVGVRIEAIWEIAGAPIWKQQR